jgi:hypothetical protein
VDKPGFDDHHLSVPEMVDGTVNGNIGLSVQRKKDFQFLMPMRRMVAAGNGVVSQMDSKSADLLDFLMIKLIVHKRLLSIWHHYKKMHGGSQYRLNVGQYHTFFLLVFRGIIIRVDKSD